jgi:hypothetical protein
VITAGKKPDSIAAPDAHERLRAAKYQKMDGANHQRFEIWLDEHGCPHVINYVGPPYGNPPQFLKKDVDELVTVN